MPYSPAPPPPLQASPPVSATGDFPDWLKFGIALLVVGGAAEAISHASRGAAYLFVLLVIMGYAATGGNVGNINQFFGQIRTIGRCDNGTSNC